LIQSVPLMPRVLRLVGLDGKAQAIWLRGKGSDHPRRQSSV